MKIRAFSCSKAVRKPRPAPVKAAFTAFLLCAGSVFAGNVGEAELAPGKSVTCFSAPCTVTFHVPEGEGTYEIRQGAPDGTKLGDYPAGETVNLGGFYNSTSFHISGGDFKPAHLWVSDRF